MWIGGPARALAAGIVGALALACSEGQEPAPGQAERPQATAPPPAAAPVPTPAAGDAARGRQVYLSVCTACHNADPTRDGSVGPASAGASRELLEAKLLRGEYPPGYVPKRPSRIMPQFQNLAGSLDDLAAFLADAQGAAAR